MNIRNIGIGIGIFILAIIIFVVFRKQPAPKPSPKDGCSPECNYDEECVNGKCVSICGEKSINNTNIPYWCSKDDLLCDKDSKQWTCDTKFCDSKNIKSKLDKWDGCDDTGFYINCGKHGKKYIFYKDQSKNVDNKCICDYGYKGDNCEYSNKDTCNDNGTVDNNGICTCYDGYYGYNCNINCTEGQIYDQINGICACDSQNGYNLIDGKCQQCDKTKIYDSTLGKCVCRDDYDDDGNGGCKPKVVCGGIDAGTLVNGVCECNVENNYYSYGNTCLLCGLNSVSNGTECICDDNSIFFEGNCQKCKNGSIPNTDKTQCILEPYILNDEIDGCNGKKYVKVEYTYGKLGDKKVSYYRDSSKTFSYTDVDIIYGKLVNGCDPETFGDNCEKNSFNQCNKCKGKYDGNSCICNIEVDKSKIIKGCDGNGRIDNYYTTYYFGNGCEYSQNIYTSENTQFNNAFNRINDTTYVAKCGNYACGKECQNSGCDSDKGCGGRVKSVTCDTNGDVICENCNQGYEGDHCKCDISATFNPSNNFTLQTNTCYKQTDGNIMNRIYKCSDFGGIPQDKNYGTIGDYVLTDPSNCKEYNDYVSRLNLENQILCTTNCPNEIKNGPFCSDIIGGVSFDCLGNCDKDEFNRVAKDCDGFTVCDVTTKYIPTCKNKDIYYNDYSLSGNCTINDSVKNEFSKICPDKSQIKLVSCTANGIKGCALDCKMPGVYTVPKACVSAYYNITETPYNIYNKETGKETIGIWTASQNGFGPIKPANEQTSDGLKITSLSQYGGLEGSEWEWMFPNNPGHIIDKNNYIPTKF
jgi:hypothetical protein